MTDAQPKITIRIDTVGNDEVARYARNAIRKQAATSVQEALGPARRGRAFDRAVWTATGIALGFGLALIAIGIYVRDLWI